LSTTDIRDWRLLILIAVLMCHIAIVLLVIRAARTPNSSSMPRYEPLVLLLLPPRVRVPDAVTSHRPADQPSSTAPKVRATKPSDTADNAISVSPIEQPPRIDWEKEARKAAQEAIADADKQNAYRNLSALSPEQLSWVRKNHLEPTVPGIPWKYSRIEVTEGGFPIIHINDHCVSIPFMMFMVFCKIGHIEPKGDLFDHMRDPHNP
jgi:hypothetical protein